MRHDTTTYLLGRKTDIERYLERNPRAKASADFLNLRGTMAKGKRGVGGWTWTRNKRFMTEALRRGIEILMVTDPDRPLHAGGNTYQRELRYLVGKGFRWTRSGEHWRVVPAADPANRHRSVRNLQARPLTA